MATYRTVERNGVFFIQKKNWLGFWVDVINDWDGHWYHSAEDAEKKIKNHQWADNLYNKKSEKVIKEYKDE